MIGGIKEILLLTVLRLAWNLKGAHNLTCTNNHLLVLIDVSLNRFKLIRVHR